MRKRKVNSKYLSLFTVLCCLGLFLGNQASAQTGCVTGCTSNDVQIQKAYLMADLNGTPLTSGCNFGDNVTAYLYLDLVTNTPRVGVSISGNVVNQNSPFNTFASLGQCFPVSLTSTAANPVTTVKFSTAVIWTCGTAIELKDVLIGWGTGNTNFCTSDAAQCPATKSKCWKQGSTNYIPVVTFPCAPAGITASPSNTTVCVSGTATFGVSFTAAANTQVSAFKWQVDKNDGAGFVDFNNSTSPYSVSALTLPAASGTSTLTINPLSNGLNGYKYRAFVGSTSSTGQECETSSSSGTLTVTPASVGGAVASNQTICTGNQPTSNLTLSNNTGSVLRWESSSDAAFTTPSTIANTTTTLTAAAIGNLTADTWFRAVVKNGDCASANSGSVKITINSASAGGTVASAQTICYNTQPANISVSGQNGTIVHWEKSVDAAFTTPIIIANTSTTLTSAQMGNLTADTWFRAVVQSGVCLATNSTSVKISVDPASVGGAVASNQSVCTGSQPANDLILSGNTGSVIRWEKSLDAAFTSPTTIANTTTTLTAAAIGALTQDTWYRAVVKNGVCPNANSGSVKITVNAIPSAPDVTYIPPTCLETTFKVSVDNPHNGSTYTLRQLNGGVDPVTKTAPANVVSGKIVFDGLTIGKGYRVTETNSGGCISSANACGDFSSVVGAARAPSQTMAIEETQTTVKAYPNPFSDRVKFMVTSSVAGNGSLEVYNMMGQKVKTVYTGFIAAGSQTFELSLPTQRVANLVYVLRVGDKKMTGKILQINK